MNSSLSEFRANFAEAVPEVVRPAGIVLGGSLLAAVCAHVAIPLVFTPVPLTLQPFAVLLLGLVLTPRMAALTLSAYLAEGALGLPVFVPTGAPLGITHLLGPTAGYLLAYPLAAALISWLWRKTGRGFASAVVSAAIGDAAILACGALWFSILPHISAGAGMALTVLPFLPGDALKVVAAAAMAAGFVRLRAKRAAAHPS